MQNIYFGLVPWVKQLKITQELLKAVVLQVVVVEV
jgi:hypothetical protein